MVIDACILLFSVCHALMYSLEVTSRQRKYGGPPPDWIGPQPSANSEVFCGKIPRDVFEDTLIPLFEQWGKIWGIRLMMNPETGYNRGYAFITYCDAESAEKAVKHVNDFELRRGRFLKVHISIPNLRLFVGNIPKSKSKEELYDKFCDLTAGLRKVIIYSAPDEMQKNRGFCFLEYESHEAASVAKRRLDGGRVTVWGCRVFVDWADMQEEPDKEVMDKVQVLYVRNLTLDTTEPLLKEIFEKFGKVERVKKIKDYAFIHFENRDAALTAMRELNGKDIGVTTLEVVLAKPPSDKRKKEEMLRARERRMASILAYRHRPQPFPTGNGLRSALAPYPYGSSSYLYCPDGYEQSSSECFSHELIADYSDYLHSPYYDDYLPSAYEPCYDYYNVACPY